PAATPATATAASARGAATAGRRRPRPAPAAPAASGPTGRENTSSPSPAPPVRTSARLARRPDAVGVHPPDHVQRRPRVLQVAPDAPAALDRGGELVELIVPGAVLSRILPDGRLRRAHLRQHAVVA